MHTIDLGRGVIFTIDFENREVATRYPDGAVAYASRPDTDENRREAADQGYVGEGAVWRSLVEHEALHTLSARAVFGRESLVLRHEAGAEPARYALRLHEEAVTISLQRWVNTREADPVLASSRVLSRGSAYTVVQGAP